MLVPLGLREPPPTSADRMLTPGAATWAIVLENSAISSFGSLAQRCNRNDAFSRGRQEAAIVNGGAFVSACRNNDGGVSECGLAPLPSA
jgi:hypothetical protein